MRVFLSYAREDAEAAAKLRISLAGHDIQVISFFEEVAVGDVILDRLQDAIRSADAILILVSRYTEKSAFVSTETSLALFARDQGAVAAVIPVLIDRHAVLPVSLRHIQAVDMTDARRWEESVAQIARAVRVVGKLSDQPSVDERLHKMRNIREALDAERADYEQYSSNRMASYATMVSVITAVSSLVVGLFAWYLSSRLSISGFDTQRPTYITYVLSVLGPLATFIVGYGLGRRRERRARGDV